MALDANRSALIREKLTLARQLLRTLEQNRDSNLPVTNEALIQGAVALLAEARDSFVLLVGQAYGLSEPEHHQPSLDWLKGQLGEDNGEVQFIESLRRDVNSWWRQLELLLESQRQPRKTRKQEQRSDLIAVAAVQDDNRSPEALQGLMGEFLRCLEEFTERHHEW